MEPGGLCNARAMSLMDSPAFHRSHNSFLPAADNPPGRPSLATPAPPIRTTPKTLPCCTDRLNPPSLSFPLTSFSKTLHPTTRDSDRCRNEHQVLSEAPPGRISAKESLKESLRRPQRAGSLYPS